MKIKIKKLNPDMKMPDYGHPGDAGLDLYSIEDYEIKPGEIHTYYFGFALEIPNGYAGIIKDKGGMGQKGIHALGGVYDTGYRGEYSATVINLGDNSLKIAKGQKVAQLLIYPVVKAGLEEVEELENSSRGEGRWGSTGK